MDAVKIVGDDLLVNIEVSPRSDHFDISSYNPWRKTLEVKLKSPPLKGKANKEIVKEFSKLTGRKVIIVSGLKSHQKIVKISNIGKKDFMKIIEEKI